MGGLSAALLACSLYKSTSLLYSLLVVFLAWGTLFLRCLLEPHNHYYQYLLPVEAIVVGLFAMEGVCQQMATYTNRNMAAYINSDIDNGIEGSNCWNMFISAVMFVVFCQLRAMRVELPMFLLMAAIYGVMRGAYNK